MVLKVCYIKSAVYCRCRTRTYVLLSRKIIGRYGRDITCILITPRTIITYAFAVSDFSRLISFSLGSFISIAAKDSLLVSDREVSSSLPRHPPKCYQPFFPPSPCTLRILIKASDISLLPRLIEHVFRFIFPLP